MFQRGNGAARKLTSEHVEMIRRLYGEGYTQGALARRYKVSVVQVGRIVRGESWQKSFDQPRGELTQPDEGMLDRLLAEQAKVGGAVTSSPPPSLLEGAEGEESEGSGLSALERAKKEFLG